MHPAQSATLGACLAAGLATIGCAGDDTNPPLPPGADAATDATTDAAAVDAASRDAEPPPLPIALVRVANWSPDSPGVDVCLAPHGTSAFQGPQLAQRGAAIDAGAQALTYPGVSAYLEVPPGTYDVRVVVAGAADCAIGIGADLTSLGALGIGSFATVALLGSAHGTGGAPKLALFAFLDDGLAKGKVALRFINAAGGIGAVDFGKGTVGAGFTPIFGGVTFGAAGAIPDAGGVDGAITSDPHGYVAIGALSAATLSAHATGTTSDVVVAHDVTVAAGAVVTATLLGSGVASADGGVTFQLLECVDNAGTIGLAGSCVVLGP